MEIPCGTRLGGVKFGGHSLALTNLGTAGAVPLVFALARFGSKVSFTRVKAGELRFMTVTHPYRDLTGSAITTGALHAP